MTTPLLFESWSGCLCAVRHCTEIVFLVKYLSLSNPFPSGLTADCHRLKMGIQRHQINFEFVSGSQSLVQRCVSCPPILSSDLLTEYKFSVEVTEERTNEADGNWTMHGMSAMCRSDGHVGLEVWNTFFVSFSVFENSNFPLLKTSCHYKIILSVDTVMC